MVVKLDSGAVESLSEQLDASLGHSDPNAQTETFRATERNERHPAAPAPPSWQPRNGGHDGGAGEAKRDERPEPALFPEPQLPTAENLAAQHARENDYAPVRAVVTPLSASTVCGALTVAAALGSIVSGALLDRVWMVSFLCVALASVIGLVAGLAGYPMLFVRRAVEDAYDVRIISVTRIPDGDSDVRPGDLSYPASRMSDGCILMRYALPADPTIRSFTVRPNMFDATVLDPYRGCLIGRSEVSDGRYTGI